jgi:hypothetical protein
MIDWTEIPDGDTWELFARDFLVALGFVVDVGPGRGADAGRDLLVSEQLQGRFGTRKFSWLVSCKHFAVSDRSVSADDEINIVDRIRQHGADGFLGFYSTLPSAGLVERLKDYRDRGELSSSEIFDRKKIEGHFFDTGLSRLALRYFPASYDHMRPIQKFFGNYNSLTCEVCGTDILARSVREPFNANLVVAHPKEQADDIESLHIVCKGPCDKTIERRLFSQGFTTTWEDIGDLVSPIFFLKNMMSYMNILHARESTVSEQGHKRMKEVYIALAQRTLREMTKEDEERFNELVAIEEF